MNENICYLIYLYPIVGVIVNLIVLAYYNHRLIGAHILLAVVSSFIWPFILIGIALNYFACLVIWKSKEYE